VKIAQTNADARRVRWSPDQEQAIKAVRRWLRDDAQVFRLFGYAGTGKTELARHLAAEAKGRVLFGAYTGKAAHVLRQKGCDDASTLHQLRPRSRRCAAS